MQGQASEHLVSAAGRDNPNPKFLFGRGDCRNPHTCILQPSPHEQLQRLMIASGSGREPGGEQERVLRLWTAQPITQSHSRHATTLQFEADGRAARRGLRGGVYGQAGLENSGEPARGATALSLAWSKCMYRYVFIYFQCISINIQNHHR